MTDVFFYHLERAPLDRVLPGLLEKTLERGWRAVVQASSKERIDVLDTLLWTYREESFLPHGAEGQGFEDQQPVLLTIGDNNSNNAQVRFFVDGADGKDLTGYERAVYLFDGRDTDAVAQAREQWRMAKSSGHDVTYWQQNSAGRWEKKA